MSKHGFTKEERLKSTKLISTLFSTGKSVKAFPILAVYTPLETDAEHHQIGFSVAKKKFKRAVDRNLLKRRMLEGYRLNKALLAAEETSVKLGVMFIYMPKEMLDFEQIEKGVKKVLKRLAEANETP